MTRYRVEVQALPAQTFNASLGKNTLTLTLRWLTRYEVFAVSIFTAQGDTLTAGRFLLPGVDVLAGLNPPPTIDYGSLALEGDEPTPANLGINNMLVWSDG